MNDKIEVSKRDVKPIQITLWVLTGISMLLITLFLIHSLTLNSLFVWLFWLVFNIILQYLNTKIWNIWYENGILLFDNIYKRHEKSILLFKKIEMTSPLGTYYKLYLNNNEKYNFGLKQSDDFLLLFKGDNQFFAKELTRRLNDLKTNSTFHPLRSPLASE